MEFFVLAFFFSYDQYELCHEEEKKSMTFSIHFHTFYSGSNVTIFLYEQTGVGHQP